MITVHPDHVSKCVLELVDTIIAVGAEPESTIAKFCEATKRRPPALQNVALDRGQVLFWRVDSQEAPIRVKVQPARSERQRHRRKYAEGDIHEKSFIFRGPEGKLNLRAQNLVIFLQMAEGLDDDTWNFHLERHDYSHWIKEAIKDQELSERVAEIEDQGLSAKESRDKVREAISEKYTQAA